MDSHDNADVRQEIQFNLNSIVEASEKWMRRLRKRERRVRLASAFLTGFLVFAGLEAIFIGFVVAIHSPAYFTVFIGKGSLVLALAGPAALAGLASGTATYFFLKRSHETRLNELSSLITQMNTEQKLDNESQVITDKALSFADKVITLLPEIVRKRNQDSLLFGIVAFIITAIVARSTWTAPVAIVVGAMVWLYFRYETGKTYEREISKFEEQRRVFEQRKKDFLETL